MATKVTRDHHSLSRNLKLNGNYISNDGDDEGISIADSGGVTFSGSAAIASIVNNTGISIIPGTGGSAAVIQIFEEEADGLLANLRQYLHLGSKYHTWNFDAGNYFKLQMAANGATTLSTVDSDGTSGHLTLDVDGDIILDAEGENIYFDNDGARHGQIGMAVSSKLLMSSGGNIDLRFASTGSGDIEIDSSTNIDITADGHVEFDGCAVGFDEIAATFGDSDVIGGGGPNTDIDFRLGNKYTVELGANLTSGSSEYLNLIFPATSGNFLLVLGQDGTGSRTISSGSWRAYQSDGSTEATNAAFANGTDGDIRWAGGSAPTLTTTAGKADIVSIYWDADNQTAFAVVSQNF